MRTASSEIGPPSSMPGGAAEVLVGHVGRGRWPKAGNFFFARCIDPSTSAQRCALRPRSMSHPSLTARRSDVIAEIDIHRFARLMIRHYGTGAAARVLRGDSPFPDGDPDALLLWQAVVRELRRRRQA